MTDDSISKDGDKLFKNSATLKNIIEITISNIISIISGIVVGLIVPKILTIEGYGYYKTFTLYTTYLSLCHLGIIDGIVLKYGGNDYAELERHHFRSIFKWYIIVNLFFSGILCLGGLLFADNNLIFIFILLGFNVVAVNVLGYYQQISQITQRFKEYSARKILQGILNVALVGILYIAMQAVSDTVDYKLYVILIVVENYILSLWYIHTYREIIFGESEKLNETRPYVLQYIKEGAPLLIANMCATLILTLDRQFVNILFDVTTYAVYSFAYNMLSLVTVATSAVSTVLYPTMKRSSEKELILKFDQLVRIILIFVFAALVLYFPLVHFINWFLPKYSESILIFRIIFAGLPLSSAITVVIHNYYKVFNKSANYFLKSVVVLVISALANGIAYWFFRTTISISIASIITMLFWFIYVEHYFIIEYHVKYKANLMYILLLMIAFYVVTACDSGPLGTLMYIFIYLGVTVALFWKDFKSIKSIIK